jgi:large subunit ribosomal protein L11
MEIKKNIKSIIKLRINAGQATASPPVGPAVSQGGLNIAEFCKNFNERTSELDSQFVLPVLIIVYTDYSYEYIVKFPTISFFLKKAASIEKGKSTSEKRKHSKKRFIIKAKNFYIGILSARQLFEIGWVKSLQFPYYSHLHNICYMICGSAHSMGLTVKQFK